MDATAGWSQGIGVVKAMDEKKAICRTQKPQVLNCPRCNSSHTKFCYYNNYNLSQPRYFCKTCRRYWTAGGSLRNVPVGGGSRKTKRSSSSSSSKINHHDHMTMTQPSSNLVSQNPNQHVIQSSHENPEHLMGIFNTANDYARRMMTMISFMPMPAGSSNTMMMNTCPDGFQSGGRYDDRNTGNIRELSTTPTAASTNARLFLPLVDLKPPSASTSDNQVQGDSNFNAYWIGGGSW